MDTIIKPLITPAELDAKIKQNEDLVVIDTRTPEEYAAGHLPGAVNLREIFSFLATSTPDGIQHLQKTFTDLFGSVGVSGDETVVIYEDAMNTGYGQSCRGWFLLRYLGHERVQILHGGLQAWKAAGLEISDAPVTPVAKPFAPEVNSSLMLTWQDMLGALEHDEIVKLDVRDADEWTGESSSPYGKDFAPRKGRIPGAVWIEWYKLMRADSEIPMFLEPEQIKQVCAEAGITADSEIYLYCFKGARASNTMVALHEAGINNVRLYFGSWNEWSRDPSLPIDEGLIDALVGASS
ncbi:MAG TPA: sulfurtransferase [Actinocrinis sp.]|uniref:sulfurtransferase n=1 Tax=Actinocrinis sp. TaxID=1920516 RepID=UPI002DDCDE24|nr:sulfurtransferase [Actinocrinis sp.]HEV2348132.1 sulfurtransferase [Actinocrinis sp.]